MIEQGETAYLRQLLAGRDLAANDPFAVAMRNYIYVIGDRRSGEAVVVDPAYAPADLLGVVEEEGFRLVGALATHYHADHVGGEIAGNSIRGIVELLELVDVPIHVQRNEDEWIRASMDLPRSALILHDDGDEISVGSVLITLVHTPGHTPGSQCVAIGDALLTGDTLFLEGCGRTDLPGGNAEELYESLHQRLARVAPETMVLPGHAYSHEPALPMSEVRTHNPVMFDYAKRDWMHQFT